MKRKLMAYFSLFGLFGLVLQTPIVVLAEKRMEVGNVALKDVETEQEFREEGNKSNLLPTITSQPESEKSSSNLDLTSEESLQTSEEMESIKQQVPGEPEVNLGLPNTNQELDIIESNELGDNDIRKEMNLPRITATISNHEEYYSNSVPIIYTVTVYTTKDDILLVGDTLNLTFSNVENLLQNVQIDSELFDLFWDKDTGNVKLIANQTVTNHRFIFNVYITPAKLEENTDPNVGNYFFDTVYLRDTVKHEVGHEEFAVFHEKAGAWIVFAPGCFSGSMWGTSPHPIYADNFIAGQGTGEKPGVFSFTQLTHTFTSGVINTTGGNNYLKNGKLVITSSNPIDAQTLRIFDGNTGSQSIENTGNYNIIYSEDNKAVTITGGMLKSLSGAPGKRQVAVNFTVITKNDVYDVTEVTQELSGEVNNKEYHKVSHAAAMFQYKELASPMPNLEVSNYMGSAYSQNTNELINNLKSLIINVSDEIDDLSIEDVEVVSTPGDLLSKRPGNYFVSFSVRNSVGNAAITQSNIKLIGNVIVKHVDTNGEEVAPSEIFSSDIEGSEYETTKTVINGYNIKTIPSNEKGKFTTNDIEVVYVYERTEAAPVTVKHQDEDGNKLSEDVVLNGKVGLPYQTEPASIKGWVLKETPMNASGTFTEEAQEVVYVYERTKAAPVTVKHQDEDGNKLSEDVVLNGKVGLPYQTEPASIKGWVLKETPMNASGTFTEEAQEVVYVYERTEAAPVTVKHQDEDGNKLSEDVVLNGKVGLPYQTEPASIKGWVLKETPMNASGTFTEEAQEVVYVYERTKAAPVTVKHQDEDGNKLSEDVVLNGKVGLPYQTEPASIKGWVLKETPMNASGTFTEEAQEVVYVYERTKAAPVTVKHQDEDGNKLSEDVVLNGKVGLPYQTEPASIKGWVLKETPMNASGTFTEEAQEVVYVYERTKAAPVTVKHQDEDGNKLSEDVVLNGKVGLPYQTEPASIKGWVLKETPMNASGTFTEEAQEVVYMYERTKAAPVTVKHQDEDGNKLSEDVVLNGKVGLPYQTEPASIKGWVLKETPMNASGTFTEEAQEVVYVYERTKAAPVTVKHQDEDGNKLSEDVVLNGKVGLPYQTEPASIKGWVLKETPMNASGTFTEEAQEVVYVYERTKAAPVTVKHQDEDGNKLSEDVVLNGKVGLPYQTEPASIKGWVLKETPMNASGTFTEEAQEVVYVYERTKAAPVTVKHQDEDGNKLSEDVVLNGKVGLPYQTEPASIKGWVLKETPMNASGTFTEEAQEVVYMYERTEAAPVTVKHQDEDGNKLSEDVVLNGKVGLPYQTEPASIKGWVLKETPMNASGTFTEEAQEVVYVYERTKAAPVTVKHQDEDGNKLSEDVVLNGKVGLPYQTEPASIKGWVLKETPMNASGTFTEEAQEVVYVYERTEAAPVTVKHQDEDGNKLSEDVVLNGKVGLPYQTEPASIKGWVLKETPMNASGTFTEEAQEVVYVYERTKAAPVTVKHQDEDGNKLSEDVVLNGKVGLPYQTEPASIKGWVLKETPMNASGTFTEEAQEVVYVYERTKAAPVTVKHQDEDGNKLSEDVVLNGKVGLPYQTEPASIKGWVLKETPMNASGTFTEEAQEVVYVYERTEAAPVTVKHQDEDGNKLSEDVVLNGKVGLPYQTEPASIKGWVLKETPMNASGTFTEEAQEVVYVYERTKAAPVTVKHQDEDGNKLSEDVVLNGKVGLPYQTEPASIKGWVLKETPMNASGTFTEEAQEVVYVYERTKAAPVTVKHQDEDGNKLSEDVVLNGKVGLPYQTEPASIKGWVLKETPMNASGTFTEEAQEVVYVYERTKAAPVTVKHQDEDGNKLSEDVVLNGKVGLPYQTEPASIKGWVLKETPMNASGTFTEEAQEVVYMYERTKAAPVTVKHQDEDGNKLSEDVVLNGKVGLPYQTEPASIKGWVLKETPMNASGTFTEEAQEVVYVYERTKAAPVTVKHQDEDGNKLSEDVVLNGKVGLPYQTEPASIKGWVLKETPMNASGTFTEEAQEVVYVYERTKAAPVTVKHQDEDGNKLSEDVVLNGKVGLPYQTEPASIKGWVLKETPMNASGTFTEEAQEVVYVYERTKAAPVTVKHQDEDGNKLSEDVVLNGKVGLPYQTEPASIKGWVLKETPMNASGTFTEEAQEVVYMYERTKAAPVTVKHQDEDGNKLSEDVVLNGKVGLPYQTEPASIKGWVLKETPMNASGTFTEEAQEVVYVYERTKAAPVTVKHQDEDGNKLSEDVVLNGKVGLPYQTEPASIKGWVLKETPMNASGTFTEEAQEVVYVYERTKAAIKPSESSNFPNKEMSKNKGELPLTGEQILDWVSLIGITLLMMVGHVFYKRKE